MSCEEDLLDPMRVRFPGPFTHHDVVVEGWTVPFLKASPRGEDRMRLILDGRLALELSSAEIERVVPFLADAISVALGFGAHPRGEMPRPDPRPPVRARRVLDVAPDGTS